MFTLHRGIRISCLSRLLRLGETDGLVASTQQIVTEALTVSQLLCHEGADPTENKKWCLLTMTPTAGMHQRLMNPEEDATDLGGGEG